MTVIVVAGILRREGQILACQRRLTDRFPGRWEFPGGKVEQGEDPATALRRELKEELGIAAEIGECIWQNTHQYPGFNPVQLHFYDVVGFAGEPLNLAFHRIAWMDPAGLSALDFLEADMPLVLKLAGQ